jgi:hypothetical protein
MPLLSFSGPVVCPSGIVGAGPRACPFLEGNHRGLPLQASPRAKQSQFAGGRIEANCRSGKGLREKVRAMRLRKQSQFVRSGLQYARKGICRGGPLCPPWATTGGCPYKEARVQNKANFRRPGPMRDRSATKGSQMGQTDGVAMPRRSHACPTLRAKSATECRPHPLVIRWEPLC